MQKYIYYNSNKYNNVSSLIIKSQLFKNLVLSHYARSLHRTGGLRGQIPIREVLYFNYRGRSLLSRIIHIELHTCRPLGFREAPLHVTQVIVMIFVKEFFAPHVKPLALLKLIGLPDQSLYVLAMLIIDFEAVESLLLQSLRKVIENLDLVDIFELSRFNLV